MCATIILMFTHAITSTKVLTLLLGILLLTGSLGLSHRSMTMGMDGRMSDCPFMPGMAVCTMTPLEMVGASHSFLTSFVLGESLLSLLLLITIALRIYTLATLVSPPTLTPQCRLTKRKLRLKYNFLTEAFSGGILNTKLF